MQNTESETNANLLPKPWRRFGKDKDPWTEDVYQSLKKEIVTHEVLEQANLNFFNVLLIGQISAGKSSFYNTIESVFSDNVTSKDEAGTIESSRITELRFYEVKAKDLQNKPLRFRFWDTMGLSAESGLKVPELGAIMDGRGEHMANGVEADKKGKMHCVVFLVDASRVAFMDESIVEKFAKIREEASSRTLNPIVILTQIDECCIDLNKDRDGDITKVFHSITVRDLVVEVSQKFGITENRVYPVKNYVSEEEKERGIDILTLRALRQILRCSLTCLDDMMEREEGEDTEAQLVRLKTGQDRAPPKKKAAPSIPKKAPVCRAIRSRPREDHDELDMVAEQLLVVLKPDDGNGWVEVKNSSGDTGLVPADWIKMGGDLGT